jgi:chaperonin cofactor prefoldin
VDNETREFLTKCFDTLEGQISSIRADLVATENRILARTEELISESKIELLNSMNQWKRTRDLRILALESRMGEIEKRVDQMQTEGGS